MQSSQVKLVISWRHKWDSTYLIQCALCKNLCKLRYLQIFIYQRVSSKKKHILKILLKLETEQKLHSRVHCVCKVSHLCIVDHLKFNFNPIMKLSRISTCLLLVIAFTAAGKEQSFAIIKSVFWEKVSNKFILIAKLSPVEFELLVG